VVCSETGGECFVTGESHGDCGCDDRLGEGIAEREDTCHNTGGYPNFEGWPKWNDGSHQQVYVDWLQRAWHGGLRLMVMLAVNSEAICGFIDGPLLGYNGELLPCDDASAIRRQIEGAYDLEAYVAETRGGWYRIAETPAEARQIMNEGDLAVVLGVETASLFGCHDTQADRERCSDPEFLHQQVADLFAQGVRHVFPIHVLDNAFGGGAMNEEFINLANDFINGHYFDLRECSSDGYDFRLVGEVDQWILDTFVYGPPGEGTCEFPPFQSCWSDGGCIKLRCLFEGTCGGPVDRLACTCPHPCTDECCVGEDCSPCVHADCNAKGLTDSGELLLRELMQSRMIIDIDHVSRAGRDRAFDIFEQECYPPTVGHTGFIAINPVEQRLEDDLTSQDLGGRCRKEMSRRCIADTGCGSNGPCIGELERINALGGMIAPILNGETNQSDDRCKGSSTSWAENYKYAVRLTEGAPIAMGSDFTGSTTQLRPRFGPDARCSSATTLPQLVYPFDHPLTEFTDLTCHGRPCLMDQQMSGTKRFDYNFDGLAHMGLLPDLVADLRTIGLTKHQLRPLMRSAEGYLNMWERIEGVAQVVYVAPNVDGCGGGTAQRPYGSMQRALDALEAGRTMILEPGEYSEHIEINEPVVIVGQDRDEWKNN
jgi:microsomal dipeptidase-like Zn-dependent dipeptidase